MKRSYIAVDIETTGLRPEEDAIIENGAVKYVYGEVIDTYTSCINPGVSLPTHIVKLTGITDEMLKDAKNIDEVLPEFLEFFDSDLILGHNIKFDFSFLKTAAMRLGHRFEKKGIDTLRLAKLMHPELSSRTLEAMCKEYKIQREHKHRAYDDAKAAAELYEELIKKCITDKKQYDEQFEPVVLNYKPKKQEPMTAKQKKYLLDLIEYHKISDTIDFHELTKSSASKLIDGIIFQYGMLSRK